MLKDITKSFHASGKIYKAKLLINFTVLASSKHLFVWFAQIIIL